MELLNENYSPRGDTLDKKIVAAPLFACTKCLKKFPFASLSEDKQCCPDCRAASISVKCLYCQAEFERSGNSSLCKHCAKNEKHFGKPKVCEWCNMLAAFNKSPICARCKHYSQKHGSPVSCERCKRDCAFDRKEENSKVGGRILCWSCMQAFRRRKSNNKEDINGNRKRPIGKLDSAAGGKSSFSSSDPKSVKTTELLVANYESQRSHETTPETTSTTVMSRSGSRETPADNFLLINELRDKISTLEKQVSSKDAELHGKDKQIAQLKTDMSVNEQQFRSKLQSLQRQNAEYVEQLANKAREVTQLQKQLNRRDKKEQPPSNNSTTPAAIAL